MRQLAAALGGLAMLLVGVVAAGASSQTVLVTSVTSQQATISSMADAGPEYVPGELIVRFRSGVGETVRASVLRAEDATLKRKLLLPGTVLLRLPAGESVLAAVEKLERHPEVLYAEPNRLYELSWARTTEQKHAGSWSVTDSPGGLYPNNDNSTLTRAVPLNLSGQDGCDVAYWMRLETESGFDILWVETSQDGVTWTRIGGWSGSTLGSFVDVENDLSSRDGQSTVHFRFRLDSDFSIQDDGAHIDDVVFKCLLPGGQDYNAINGTSMASPHAAGVAALLLAQGRTPAQAKTDLTSSVDVLGQFAPYTIHSGRLNACKALGRTAADCNLPGPPLTVTPNDPRYGELWGLNQANDADIDAAQAWGVTTGSGNVIVAVIDSGVAYDNQDVAPNMWVNDDPPGGGDNDGNGFVDDTNGWDFWEGNNTPLDENGHGTHVAGTIGAQGNNALGVVGVNWDVSIMALRAGGPGTSLSTQAITDSIVYACANGAKVVNGSFGSSSPSPTMAAAITSVPCENTLFVFSAGNENLDLDVFDAYPCEFHRPPTNATNVLCIAASDQNDQKASFSNHGTSAVHFAAPGVGILSTWPAQQPVTPQPLEDFETDLAGRWISSAPPPPPPPAPPPPPPPTVPPCPPTDVIIGATYRGTYGSGGAVCLTVTPGWTGVLSFLITNVPGTPSCGFSWVHFRYPTPLPISNRRFNHAGFLSGTFPTDRGATGTASWTSGGCTTGQVTWNATTDGTPPWVVPPSPPPPPRRPAQARCVVPNVKGKTVVQARRMLSSKRCALGRVNRAYSGRVGRSKIISQSRRPGARLPRGTRVNVLVSRGRRR